MEAKVDDAGHQRRKRKEGKSPNGDQDVQLEMLKCNMSIFYFVIIIIVKQSQQRLDSITFPGGGGGNHNILSEGVPPSPEKPYPLSDQNVLFSISYFRPDSPDIYPIPDAVRCGNFSNSQWTYGVRDFVTPQTMFPFLFFRDPRQHTVL